MALKSIVGEITDSHEKADVQWKIPDFSKLTETMREDEFIESPQFYFFKVGWCLRLFPSGDSQSGGWIALYLSVKSFSDGMIQCPITFTLSIKDYNKEIQRGKETHHIFQRGNPSYGWTKVIQRHELAAFKAAGLHLIVCCKAIATILFDAACQTSECSSPLFNHNFQHLLASGKKSDVTIKVDDQLFKTHKWILENCSSVFSAMFENDVSQKHDPIVNIDDCDPSAFKNFLQCIYTGKVENVLPENLLGVYIVADRYCVIRLKEKCAELMAEQISANTACNILILAIKYKETKLKKSAVEFILRNIQAIPKIKWRWLMTENALLAAEILTKKFLYSEETMDHGNNFT